MFTPRLKDSSLLPGLLVLLLAVVAVGCDGMGASDFGDRSQAVDRPEAAKRFDQNASYVATFTDNKGTEWSVVMDGDPSVDGTRYTYHYTVGVNAFPSTSAFVALETPSCAGTWVSADPVPGVNNNANGTIEWKENDLAWTVTNPGTGAAEAGISYTFEYGGPGPLPLGLVRVSFKTSGTGSDVETGVVLGPCSGHYTIEGNVVVNTPDGAMGIEGVALTLYEDPEGDGSYTADPDFGPVLTDDAGYYSFEVWGPSVHSGHYKVSIEDAGANAVFFDLSFFELVSPGDYFRLVTPDSASGNDFVFRVNADAAISAFNAGTVASDGLPRAYWRVQVTGKGSPKYQPELEPPTAVFPLLEHFVTEFGVQDLYDLGASPESALYMASEVLKTANNNNIFEALRTYILAMGLNWADPRPPGWVPGAVVPAPGSTGYGRGLCSGPAPQIDPTTGRCFAYDEAGTRIIIEHAIGALRGDVNSPYHASKAPTGSGETTSTTTLSSMMTNDSP